MKFHIEKHSPIPVQTQIKERIKIGLTLGELRPGDTLPSIRDMEKQLGVGRAIIRSAYLELQECGILVMKHGRRVIVNDFLDHHPNNHLMKTLEEFVDRTLNQARKLDVSNSSFAKFLLHKALERDRRDCSCLFVDSSRAVAQESADQISQMWETPISALSIDDLPDFMASHEGHVQKIIVNYYRFNEVSEIVKSRQRIHPIDVIPISMKFAGETVERLKALPPRSKVLLVADDRDFERHGQTFADAYKEAFRHQSLEFNVQPYSEVKNLDKIGRSKKYKLILISNRIWDSLPDKLKNIRTISHPRLEVDRTSLEKARVKAGIIV